LFFLYKAALQIQVHSVVFAQQAVLALMD
jgi:hypothetical protein